MESVLYKSENYEVFRFLQLFITRHISCFLQPHHGHVDRNNSHVFVTAIRFDMEFTGIRKEKDSGYPLSSLGNTKISHRTDFVVYGQHTNSCPC